MEPLGIVDLLDEPGQPLSNVSKGLVASGLIASTFSVFMKLSACALW